MRYLLLSSLLALGFAVSAQIPDYVPTDGLVAWWSFNGTTDEEFGLTSESQVAFGEDRFGEGARALDMLNSTSMFVDYGSEVMDLGQLQSITISLWSKLDDASAYNHFVQHRTDQDVNYNFVLSNNNQGLYAYHGTSNDSLLQTSVVPPTDEWFMLTWTLACDADSVRSSMYLDGALIGQESFGLGCLSSLQSDVLYVGGGYGSVNTVKGSIDDLGLWDRPLTASEVLSFYNDSAPLEGCTDASACNFNSDASVDNGTCHFYCLFCNDGTVWNEVTQGCDVANPSDTDFDGCVGMTDLLDLLSTFGTCNETPWSCGDPLEYQGYDYETVQIGEQCWFAENARYLPQVSPPSFGSENDEEAHAYVYDYYGSSPSDAQMHPNYIEYGVLYNFQAVVDWQLCPVGWHVSNSSDWYTLADNFGGLSEAGPALMSSSGWVFDNEGNGSNVSGFNGKPAGDRNVPYQTFYSMGRYGFFWTSNPEETGANSFILRSLGEGNAVGEMVYPVDFGISVRCIQDSE